MQLPNVIQEGERSEGGRSPPYNKHVGGWPKDGAGPSLRGPGGPRLVPGTYKTCARQGPVEKL